VVARDLGRKYEQGYNGEYVIIHLPKSIECITPCGNPSVDDGLCMIMRYQYRFINCKAGKLIMEDCICGSRDLGAILTFCSVLL
jgi:hypothetical protein